MKICHVCNSHTVDDGRVFHRSCIALAEAGYEVHLFAIGKEKQPYRHKGVFIHPLPQSSGRLQRFSRRSRIAKMAAALNPDLFHVHEPEFLGPVLRHAGSKPVVYDVHESYLDVLNEREWIPRWLRPLFRLAWERRERDLVPRCGGVVVVTERIAQRYFSLNENVQVVGNFPNLTDIPDTPTEARDGRTCVFAGVLRADRGLSEVISALGILQSRGLAVSLELAGPPAEGYLDFLLEKANRLGIRQLITYHGILLQADTWNLLKRSSIGLVTYLPVANSMLSIANKLTECMAVGLPVVFSNFPNYREIAEQSGAGIPVDPTNPEEIADALERLVRNPDLAKQMGEAARQAVCEKFNWEVHSEKLLRVYQNVLGLPENGLASKNH